MTETEQVNICVFLEMNWQYSIIAVAFLIKMLNLNLCLLGTSAKPKLRDILQNNWTVVFENIKVMICEDKEKPFNSPSLG